MVRVRVNYVRDSFSVLLRAHFVSATTANNIEPNIKVHIINSVHVNKANWVSLVYNNYCRMVRNTGGSSGGGLRGLQSPHNFQKNSGQPRGHVIDLPAWPL